jgi:hypothetical protein
MISKALPAALLFALLLAMPAAGAVDSAAAQGPPVISVKPPSQSVQVGSRVTVDITISNASNIGAFEFILHFDPTVLAYADVREGPFLGSGGKSVSCLPPILYEDDVRYGDSVRYGCATPGTVEEPGVDGAGLLATVTFDAINDGRSPLTFVAGTGPANPNGDSLPFDVEEGIVAVVAAGDPVPTTPEPTPTRNPVALTPAPPSDVPTPVPGFVLPTPGPGTPTAAAGSSSSAPGSDGAGAAPTGPNAGISPTEPGASTPSSAGSVTGTTVPSSGDSSAVDATGAPGAAGAAGAGGATSPASGTAAEAESAAGSLAIAGQGAPPRTTPIWPTVAGAVLALLGVTLLLGGTVGLRRLSERQVDRER